jgi:hypothetical protein
MKLANTCYSSELPNALNVNTVMMKVPKNVYRKGKYGRSYRFIVRRNLIIRT